MNYVPPDIILKSKIISVIKTTPQLSEKIHFQFSKLIFLGDFFHYLQAGI